MVYSECHTDVHCTDESDLNEKRRFRIFTEAKKNKKVFVLLNHPQERCVLVAFLFSSCFRSDVPGQPPQTKRSICFSINQNKIK